MIRAVKLAHDAVQSDDRDKARLSEGTRRTVEAINAMPLLGARLIDAEPGAAAGSGLSFTGGVPRAISHGLGRKARGFFELYAVDVPSAAVVGLRPTAMIAGVTSDTHVTVTPSNTGTAFLLVF